MKLMSFIKLFPREDLRIRYPDFAKSKTIKGKLERQYLHDRR
ncbi:MAG: hypothetical protein A4E74_00224 [Syntrophus sp. PtaB.Bin075]|nr:MAG: hypothetical protein A4E74_00224 [Syntrophus sp. PtaB.Bin075]